MTDQSRIFLFLSIVVWRTSNQLLPVKSQYNYVSFSLEADAKLIYDRLGQNIFVFFFHRHSFEMYFFVRFVNCYLKPCLFLAIAGCLQLKFVRKSPFARKGVAKYMEDKKQTSFTFEIDNFSEKEAGRRSPQFLAGGCEW